MDPAPCDRLVALRTGGHGSCLFLAARLALELRHVLKCVAAGSPPTEFSLDGTSAEVVASGDELRAAVCAWYERGLDKPLPSMGEYVSGPSARPWTRGDLLALEMVQRGEDVPEHDAPRRREVQLAYLAAMRKPHEWGGPPELAAVTHMSGLSSDVYEFIGDGLLATNPNKTTEGEAGGEPFRISVLFHKHHYSCLARGDDWDVLCAAYGQEAMAAMCAPAEYRVVRP